MQDQKTKNGLIDSNNNINHSLNMFRPIKKAIMIGLKLHRIRMEPNGMAPAHSYMT
jgi:hypothetical protein